MHQAPGASCGMLYYPGLVSYPFYAIPLIIPFLIDEIFHFTCFLPLFLLFLAVTVIECNNNFLFFTSIIILIKIAVNGRGQSSAHHTLSRNKVA